MIQMAYTTAKPLLDNGTAIIVNIQREVLGFGWLAIIKVDGKQDYQLKLSAAQKLALAQQQERR